MAEIKLPKYTLLEKDNLGGFCDACSRSLKNVYTVRNNETKEVGHFGSGCFKTFTEGKSVTEVADEQEVYEKAVKQAELDEIQEAMGRTFVESFQEAEPVMLEYIMANLDNNFVKDMKERIETSGSLTTGQYEAIYRMMLPYAKLEEGKRVTLKVFPSKLNIYPGFFDGWEYHLFAITENDEMVKVYFSSMNDQKEQVLVKSGVLGFESDGEYITYSTIEREKPIEVTGTFDGYKLKRAKIEVIK